MEAPSAKPDPMLVLFSYYRDAELRGSNLIYRMLRMLPDGDSQLLLAEHLADETRHAWLWTERIKQMGAAVDLLALTVVVEQRALRRYQEHLRRPGVDERTREVLRAVSKDEGWHIEWIRKKGRELAEADGTPDRFERALERFRTIDREVWAELEAFEQSLGLID
jgi:hypothetical protein